MATLAEMLRQGADRLINLPSEAQRFVTNPQAFTQLLTGKNPLPRETGFAAGATGLPAQEMSVLDPNQAPYMQGYSQGEPIGYAGMAAPFAAPAAVATAKALAPKLGQVTENYMVKQGMIQPLTAYHGTPHTIQGQFDINKVGTGEGAQSYGHGMYFAENPNVAKDYQKKLSESELIYEGKPLEDQYDALRQKYGNVTGSFLEYAADNGITDAKNLIANYLKNPAEKANFGDTFIQNATNKQLEKALNDLNDVERLSKGNLYKVDIPDADIPMMLDWDKPLLQQTPQVQEALAKLGIKTDKQKLSQFDDALLDALMNDAKKPLPKQPINPTGQDIYQTFVQGSPQLTSQKLNEAGIRGIRYLDEGSRSANQRWIVKHPSGGENDFASLEKAQAFINKYPKDKYTLIEPKPLTSNFVVFEPSTVKILEKNNQPVTRKKLIQQQIDKIE